MKLWCRREKGEAISLGRILKWGGFSATEWLELIKIHGEFIFDNGQEGMRCSSDAES